MAVSGSPVPTSHAEPDGTQHAGAYVAKPPHSRNAAHQAWLTLQGLMACLLVALPR